MDDISLDTIREQAIELFPQSGDLFARIDSGDPSVIATLRNMHDICADPLVSSVDENCHVIMLAVPYYAARALEQGQSEASVVQFMQSLSLFA